MFASSCARLGTLLVAFAIAAALTACGDNGSSSPTATSSAPTATLPSATSTASPTLVPAESQGPAAGACDPQPGTDVVTFTIQGGIPQPRCAQATQNQHVRLINNIGQSVTITFAGRTLTIADGATQDVSDPVGTYLAPGVHVAHVDAYGGSGPEIWVQP